MTKGRVFCIMVCIYLVILIIGFYLYMLLNEISFFVLPSEHNIPASTLISKGIWDFFSRGCSPILVKIIADHEGLVN